MEIKIGSKLRELRTQKKMSIAELSKLSEVSTGLISQIERDLVVPSVISLYRLALALKTDLNYFFVEQAKMDGDIIRNGEHRILSMNHDYSFYKLLTPNNSSRSLDMIEVRIQPGGTYEEAGLCHEGEECGYVIKGTLTLALNGQDYTLYEGDSITFKSTLPHRYKNLSNEECVSVWSMTPKFF
ncbi:cupin domain-containing protein [Chakrabartyella piscis]|uniref:cupin domain-containing protein n=1 Tax=Chakrabartyella piscis TaxID=2918914 RepID=UPI002958C88D|nr:cupin domain-containing protein [Chakrabartyella piscis]